MLTLAWMSGLVVLGFVHVQSEAPVELLLVDPALSSGVPWYAGLVTSLGAIGWTTATVSAWIGSRVATWVGRDNAVTMFRGGALLFLLLTLDDVFGFHSWVIPDALGTTKLFPLGVYAALAAGWVVTNRVEIARTRSELLGAAVVAFGMSVGIDLLVGGQDVGTRALFEDGAKFMGVLALAAWSTATTLDVLGSVIRRAEASTPETDDTPQVALSR